MADPGCLSRIPDPDFYSSRISDPGSRDPKKATKERGEKKFFFKHFFVATNFTKCKIILFLNCPRKKFEPNFKELWNFLPKKLSLRSQKYEWDPGYGIRDPGVKKNKPIPDPGSRIPESKRHRIPDPQHCSSRFFLLGAIPQRSIEFEKLVHCSTLQAASSETYLLSGGLRFAQHCSQVLLDAVVSLPYIFANPESAFLHCIGFNVDLDLAF